MSWGVLPWVYPVWDSLGFLDLGDYFLPHFRELFNYYLLKYFLMVFLFVFFFWDPYDSNVVAFNIVLEVSEIVLISIKIPIFEATELFARGLGATTDVVEKEMYTFPDLDGKSLTLRPEGTAGAIRAYIEHHL